MPDLLKSSVNLRVVLAALIAVGVFTFCAINYLDARVDPIKNLAHQNELVIGQHQVLLGTINAAFNRIEDKLDKVINYPKTDRTEED